MKRLILLLGLCFLFSCQKDDIFCWECKTTMGEEILYIDDLCGWTEDEVIVFEKTTEYRVITSQLNRGIKGIMVECKCKKKD